MKRDSVTIEHPTIELASADSDSHAKIEPLLGGPGAVSDSRLRSRRGASLGGDSHGPMHTKYGQLMDALRTRISSAVYVVGETIPPESRLQAEFGVSRITVRRAVDELAREGLLRKEQGRGTFVYARGIITQPLSTLVGVTETMVAMGVEPQDLERELVREEAIAAIAGPLEVPTGTPVWHLSRVRGTDDRPICVIHNYIRMDLVPGLSVEGLLGSVYQTYELVYGLTLARAEEIVTAGAASQDEAMKLFVRRGAPLLIVRRTTYLDTGEPIEISIVRSRPDSYRYTVALNGRPTRLVRPEITVRSTGTTPSSVNSA